VKLSVVTTSQQAVSHPIPGMVSKSAIAAFHFLVISSSVDG
jgi:hypothetical protein